MEALNEIQQISVLILPVLLAITVHEAAHGWMARRLGDRTAEMLGRVSLNPLRHIDPLGTVLVPLATFLMTGFLFGWAKPVPIDRRNLRHPRRDEALVALAGPGANLLMAALWSLAILGGVGLLEISKWVALPLIYSGAAGVLFNAVLMVLNLVPILPLDGGRVLSALLPPRWSYQFSRMEPFGLLIVVALLVTGMLGRIVSPLVSGVIQALPGTPIVLELFLR